MNNSLQHIRLARPGDLEAIDQIYNHAIHSNQTAHTLPLSSAERKEWFNKHGADYPVYVYEFEKEVAGWLSFSAYREGRQALQSTVEISFYLSPSMQGKGIGANLVNFATTQAPSLGFKNLFAVILESNTPSIRLMEKCGFKQWGLLPGVAELNGKNIGHVYYGMNLL